MSDEADDCNFCLAVNAQEAVNHPDHYGGDTTHEVIKCLEAWAERAPIVMDLRIGQAIIYLARAGAKDPQKLREDIEKAHWWLGRYLQAKP